MIGCVGDVILDISVRPEMRVRSGTDTPAELDLRRGGSAANTAVEAAQLSGKSRFIGAVGQDQFGEILHSDLLAQGVEVCGGRVARSGCVVAILNNAGEATMLTDRADSARLCSWESEWLDGLSALHVTSYAFFAEPLATVARQIIMEAKGREILVSVDASSVGLLEDLGLEQYTELLGELSPDLLLANAAEAKMLADATDLKTLANVVVVKRGALPTRLLIEEEETEISPPEVEVVTDTLGAGDVFAAALLVAKTMRQQTWEESIRAAQLAANSLLMGRAGSGSSSESS